MILVEDTAQPPPSADVEVGDLGLVGDRSWQFHGWVIVPLLYKVTRKFLSVPVLAENVVRAGRATWWYSLRMPPSF
jgi:hypothetical protein